VHALIRSRRPTRWVAIALLALPLTAGAQPATPRVSARVALVPLDDRPVCLQLPVMLGEVADTEVITPPRGVLGRFQKTGDGDAIARWLETLGEGALQIEEGSLYPALYRLERKGWIEAEWGLSETKRKVKLYRLTDSGRERLQLETAQWSRFSDAVARILHTS
jgi:transcriptional regulator